MTDKVQKIREKVERIKTNANKRGAIGKYSTMIICAEILSLIDSLQEEPVSEDLEEAAIDYDSCRPALYGEDDEGDYVECIEVRKDAFIAGAKWGKNQAKAEIQAQSMALAHGCPKEEPVRNCEICPQSSACAFGDRKKCVFEEPVSEDLESAIEQYKRLYNVNCDNHSLYHQARFFADFGINWQKEQFEKNRLAACHKQTEEEAEIEQNFVMSVIEKEHRQPTFDDAIKYGMRLQKEQMMAKAVDVEVKVDAGGYPYIDKTIELYDYIKDVPLAKEGDKYKVVLIKK